MNEKLRRRREAKLKKTISSFGELVNRSNEIVYRSNK